MRGKKEMHFEIFFATRNRNYARPPKINPAQYRKKGAGYLHRKPVSPISLGPGEQNRGTLAFDHGNFNQPFSHFIGNSSLPSPFKHCLGQLSAAGSISGNYTCKVMLGAQLNISAKCVCC
jgi:hypothetical protein